MHSSQNKQGIKWIKKMPLFFNGLNIVCIYVSGMGDYTILFHKCHAMESDCSGKWLSEDFVVFLLPFMALFDRTTWEMGIERERGDDMQQMAAGQTQTFPQLWGLFPAGCAWKIPKGRCRRSIPNTCPNHLNWLL